jgi:integrase
MSGCRPLSQEEVAKAAEAFSGRFAVRNRCLFILGVLAGFRIREMLSLRVADVTARGKVRLTVRVARRHMKGKQESRVVYLAPEARRAILDQIRELGYPAPDSFLFRAQGGENKAISYTQARRVLQDAFGSCGIAEDVATHSMRKTFANETYEFMLAQVAEGRGVDPFMEVSQALGHKDPKSTTHYLSFRDENRRAAIRHMGRMLHADVDR